jgi:uncharacterized protein
MTGSVFDFHARLVRRPDALAAHLATMDAVGIERAAVSAGGLVDLDQLSAQISDGGRSEARADNDWVRRCCAASGGRLVPFFFADPYADVDTYRTQARRFRGLEISPAVHGFPLDATEVAALVSVAASVGHPVYVVCLGRPGARTRDLVELARAFPDVVFVFGHCGWTAIDTVGLAEIAPYENVAAETSGCFTAVAEVALRRLGPDRVLFGTEYPLQHPSVELAKLAALDLAKPVRQKVAWQNALRLLGEEIPCAPR